jgi:hypothetical protein
MVMFIVQIRGGLSTGVGYRTHRDDQTPGSTTLHHTGVYFVIPQFECIWAKNARWASGRCEIVSLRPKSIPAELRYADNTPPVALHGRGLMCKHGELVVWWSARVQQERPFGRARVKALNGSRSLKRIAVSAS